MKPMSELKTECRNYEKILLKNNHGSLFFGYYEDGMIRLEGSHNYSMIFDWNEWMLASELKKLID